MPDTLATAIRGWYSSQTMLAYHMAHPHARMTSRTLWEMDMMPCSLHLPTLFSYLSSSACTLRIANVL